MSIMIIRMFFLPPYLIPDPMSLNPIPPCSQSLSPTRNRLTYKNHLNSGFFGPSLNFSVLTSLAL